MFTEVRTRGSQPTRIGEEARDDLLDYRDTYKFKEKLSQNKLTDL